MKKIIIFALLVVSCSQTPKQTKRCIITEVKNTKTSTIQEFDPTYVVNTDSCGWVATKKKGLKIGDTITVQIP